MIYKFIKAQEAIKEGIEFIPFIGYAYYNWPYIFAGELSADTVEANGIQSKASKIYLQPVNNNIIVVDDCLHTWSYADECRFEQILQPVFVKKDGIWTKITEFEYHQKEDRNKQVSHFDESRSYQTVIEQFGSEDAFWDYVNS